MASSSPSTKDLAILASITPCTPEDYADLRELHKAAVRTSGWRFYSLEEVAAKIMEIDDPEYTSLRLKENVLLARIGTVLAGTTSWRPSNEHPQTAIITLLSVNPLFEGGGIASALVKEAEQAAYDTGFRWISARSDLNYRTLFSRLGYEGKEFRDEHPQHGTAYPLQVMTRHISAHYSARKLKQGPDSKLATH